MPENSYDVVVIGSGTGGYSTALRAAGLGKRVAMIEKDDRLGGTCLLRGCIPTKALLQSAAVLDSVHRSEEWGITASGEPDMPGVLAFQKKMVDKLVNGLTGLVKARKIDVIQGEAKLAPGPKVEVAGRTLEAGDVVLATGSRPRLLLSKSAPESICIIGAGAVGVEFATFYNQLGVKVTLLEALDRLVPLEDEDVSKELVRAFRRRGITTAAGAKVSEVKDSGDGVAVTYDAGGKTETANAELCLVAVGRGPVGEGLGYEEAGVELERGYVKVDGQLQTTVPHVWAVGDVAATPFQLAHVSFEEGIAVAERIAGEEVPEIDYAGIPRVTFSTPEIASVGLTEAQARERGYDLDVEKLNFQAIGKANIVGEGGLCKVIAEQGGGAVLGVHLIGPHVTDLVAEGMLIYNWEAVPTDVARLIHPHPTLSEAIGEAHLALAGKSLHTL